MKMIRKATERGTTRTDWLDSKHSFSFAGYHDPRFEGFRTLRVINDDKVAPSKGFGTHPHRDMEILTWVVSGELEHRDSMGNGSVIRPGELQRMSAGTGVLHSEMNPSTDREVRLFQIWILPERPGLTPGYEQIGFDSTELTARLRLIASQDGRDGSITIHQDASVFAARLTTGTEVTHRTAADRGVWVQVVHGEVEAAGVELGEGDAVAVTDEGEIRVLGKAPAEILLFDLG